MNILLINKSYFANELEALGARVLVAAVQSESSQSRFDSWSLERLNLSFSNHESIESIFSRLPAGFKPDAIVYHDDSHPFFRVEGLERARIPILFYQVDAHIHYSWFPFMSGVVSTVWIGQRDYLKHYSTAHWNVEWVPLWAPTWNRSAQQRDIDVCFRGSLELPQRTQRVQFLKGFTEAFKDGIVADFGSGAYRDVYGRSKIVLNESISDDVNFRIFEALSSGAMLLTPRVDNGLSELFDDGGDLVTYERGNVGDAVAKFDYYLSHETERSRIADSGCAKVLKFHTPMALAKKMFEVLQIAAGRGPFPNLAAAFRIAWSAKADCRRVTDEEALKIVDLLEAGLVDEVPPARWLEFLPFMFAEILTVANRGGMQFFNR